MHSFQSVNTNIRTQQQQQQQQEHQQQHHHRPAPQRNGRQHSSKQRPDGRSKTSPRQTCCSFTQASRRELSLPSSSPTDQTAWKFDGRLGATSPRTAACPTAARPPTKCPQNGGRMVQKDATANLQPTPSTYYPISSMFRRVKFNCKNIFDWSTIHNKSNGIHWKSHSNLPSSNHINPRSSQVYSSGRSCPEKWSARSNVTTKVFFHTVSF